MNWHFVRKFDGPHLYYATIQMGHFCRFFSFIKLIILLRVLNTTLPLFVPELRFNDEVESDCIAFMIPLELFFPCITKREREGGRERMEGRD